MILTFRDVSGKSYQIEIDSSSTVQTAKQILSDQCEINAKNIQFLLNKKMIPDSELIKNLYISSNDFILFYETTSETELNSVPDQISTPPQLCHTKGAPELSTLQSDDKKDILEKNQRSPDFHTNQELQIMKPYLTEPIFTQVNVKPDIFAFIDRSFNPQFSSEFKQVKVPLEKSYLRGVTELLKPTYSIVDVSEKVNNCVDQSLKSSKINQKPNVNITAANPSVNSNLNQNNINVTPSTNLNPHLNQNTNINATHATTNINSNSYVNPMTHANPNSFVNPITQVNQNTYINTTVYTNSANFMNQMVQTHPNTNVNPNTYITQVNYPNQMFHYQNPSKS